MDCIELRKLEVAAIPWMRQSCLGVSKSLSQAQYQERDINCSIGWWEPPIVEKQTIRIEQKEAASASTRGGEGGGGWGASR